MVYLIGGDATDGGVVNEVFTRIDFRLPLKDREWIPLPKTTFERTAVTLVSMGQYVYAIGGNFNIEIGQLLNQLYQMRILLPVYRNARRGLLKHR